MTLTRFKLGKILELFPDFKSYEGEVFKFQIHKREAIVFTLTRRPDGIPVYELIFRKNQKIQGWECECSEMQDTA